jgi:Helix-turn-helix domain
MHPTQPEQGEFARLLASIQERAGLSYQQVADAAGVNRSQAWRWVNSGSAPGYEHVRRLAAHLVAAHPQLADAAAGLLPAAGYRIPPVSAEPAATPEPATPDSGDDAAGAVVAGNVSTAVIRAAVPATVRAIWTRVRRELAPELFTDARQARAWPPGSAPLEVTPEVETILDAMRDTLFPGQVENAASRLVKYTWPERVMVAAASLDVLGQRPTIAARRVS